MLKELGEKDKIHENIAAEMETILQTQQLHILFLFYWFFSLNY